MKDFRLAEETLGYVTNEDPSNTDIRFLVDGSKNVLIDVQKRVKIRSGYERLGAANTSLTQNRDAISWETSTGHKRYMRFYDDELEVYLPTIDGYAVNAWKRVRNSWSTTERLRTCIRKDGSGGWYDATEALDLMLMVNGNDLVYAWNGAVAIVDSVTANTIKKKGTTTFLENRFFGSANKTLINVRTGTEFTYTGGEDSTTLTGVSGSPVTDGMVAGDVLVQKVIENADTPAADRNNHTIYNHNNQICVGSDDDANVYISKDDDYTDYTEATPRIPGDGGTLTLDNPARGFCNLGGKLSIFVGSSSMFQIAFVQVDVGGTLTENIEAKRYDLGVNRGLLLTEALVELGDEIAYLTNEVALRIINDPSELTGLNPKTLSNPIKPDFDAETWFDSNNKPDAHGIWYKNMLLFTAPQESRMYMLNFVEDADGKLFRFWNPPQVLPAGPMSIIDLDDEEGKKLYLHSNATPETYELFTGQADGVYSGIASKDKLPIDAKAVYAYNNYKKRGLLKNFDEYFVDGEITQNTDDLLVTFDYDYGGATQSLEFTIDGSDETFLEGNIGFNALAQQSLAINPLGGLLNPPADARRFRWIKEIAKEDFFEIRVTFSTNSADRYWCIVSHGANVELSKRRPINIHN